MRKTHAHVRKGLCMAMEMGAHAYANLANHTNAMLCSIVEIGLN
jgi:hypothetical protein